jgi:hypothetical protein
LIRSWNISAPDGVELEEPLENIVGYKAANYVLKISDNF